MSIVLLQFPRRKAPQPATDRSWFAGFQHFFLIYIYRLFVQICSFFSHLLQTCFQFTLCCFTEIAKHQEPEDGQRCQPSVVTVMRCVICIYMHYERYNVTVWPFVAVRYYTAMCPLHFFGSVCALLLLRFVWRLERIQEESGSPSSPKDTDVLAWVSYQHGFLKAQERHKWIQHVKTWFNSCSVSDPPTRSNQRT